MLLLDGASVGVCTQADLCSRIDEIVYLRETLKDVRDELQHEKQLNSAIKSRKVRHFWFSELTTNSKCLFSFELSASHNPRCCRK